MQQFLQLLEFAGYDARGLGGHREALVAQGGAARQYGSAVEDILGDGGIYCLTDNI